MKHILVVDDDPVFASLIAKQADRFIDVSAVESFEEFKKEPLSLYDGFIIDYDLQESTGLELIEYLEQNHIHRPVFVVSASSAPGQDPIHPVAGRNFQFLTKWQQPARLLQVVAASI